MFYYITGNKHKIEIAERYLPGLGIEYEVKSLELTEIQSHSIEEVARAKAEAAYAQLKNPIPVNDQGWSRKGLNGFPGAYMKYINEWFTPEDFLNLTKDLANREVILTEAVCYKDAEITKSFTKQHVGILLSEIQGEGIPAMTIISLTGDGVSVAKKFSAHLPAFDELPIWEDFAAWYITK